MEPAEGERAAVTGFTNQYRLAARVVRAKLATLEWIRVADPAAGVADDFQFKSGPTRHAVQVKWSQYPTSYPWSALVNSTSADAALMTELAQAWRRLKEEWSGPLVIHLCSNDYASTATPRSTSPLAKVQAAPPRYFAAFLARAFEPVQRAVRLGTAEWNELARLPQVSEWSTAWDALRKAADLGDDEFAVFVGDLELNFATPADVALLRPDHDPADSELATLAWKLQEIVADRTRPVQLTRDELLNRLGWGNRLEYRHPHRFPVPAVYEANYAARDELEQRFATLTGGYVALVGPAGCGKSTLLASLSFPGRVVRYYAFVPDAPDPLSSRGEADSFLHDVSLTLEQGGLHRSGYGNDLRSQRLVLLDQLDRAGRRWRDRDEKTIVVVDGLDHIPREQNPQRSLIEELPSPAALPDGVFVVLGTQTMAILPHPIQAVLKGEGRTVYVPPLAPNTVGQLADASGCGAWMYPGQRDDLVAASEGHPLALTYLLQELNVLEQIEPDSDERRRRADRLLQDATTSYGSDVQQRYLGYFRAVGDDQGVVELLGAVARLRAPVNLDWLATWADQHAVDAFTKRTATFFHRNGTEWRFIHNSFRRFLAEQTAQVAGRFDQPTDRHQHMMLADVCARSGPEWPLYQEEELAHRYLASQYDRVLELAAPGRLRSAILDLRPMAMVHDHAVLALRAAAGIGDSESYLRILLFITEIWYRTYVIKPDELAATVVKVQTPMMAMEHIVRGGRLRIRADTALGHAIQFAAEGNARAAQVILGACGGLTGLTDSQDLSPSAVADWAEVSWNLSGLDYVLQQLDHHLPHPNTIPDSDSDTQPSDPDEKDWQRERRIRDKQEHKATIVQCRNVVHARCFDLLSQIRDDRALDALTATIDAEASPGWRARARLVRARAALEDQARHQLLLWVREVLDIDTSVLANNEDDESSESDAHQHSVPLHLRIKASELLLRAGFIDAEEIDRLVPAGTSVAWPSSPPGQQGLRSFETMLDLAALRTVRPDPSLNAQPHLSQAFDKPGKERLRRALEVLSTLEGQHLAAQAGIGEPPAVAAHADPIVRLLELRPHHNVTEWYGISDAGLDLFRRTIRLAAQAGGRTELAKLLRLFDQAWNTKERARFWSPERKNAVITAALKADAGAEPWAEKQLRQLDLQIDGQSHDPHDRTTNWLTQAKAWAIAGDVSRAQHAARRAVQASLGAGVHDEDDQLREWLHWLQAAHKTGQLTTSELLDAVRDFASRITAAASEASSQAGAAAEELVAMTFPTDPALACALAEFLCDAGVLEESDAVQTVVVAASHDSAIPPILPIAAATMMLLPTAHVLTSGVHERLQAKALGDELAARLLREAVEVWHGPDERDEQQLSLTDTGTAARDDIPATVGALLTALRNANDATDAPVTGWDTAVADVASVTVSAPIARELLAQATRLRLGGSFIGTLAAMAAKAGAVKEATAALAESLARTPGGGWRKHYDGGSRLKIFGAALQDRHPELVRLAMEDLAGTLATDSVSAQFSPDDLMRIADLIAGQDLISTAWPGVVDHLDQFAPAGASVPDADHIPVLAASPSEAFLRWVAGYLGHPARPLDFGARRTLHYAFHAESAVAQRVLTETINSGGWSAEAALHTITTLPPTPHPPPALSTELATAIKTSATGIDAINRDLARRVAERFGVQAGHAARRPLPAAYRLTLPPLPDLAPPELDDEGMPYLDLHNPLTLIAPFDEVLAQVAEAADQDLAAVVHRAGALAKANIEPWLQGGHRAHADRIKRRGQRLAYRPWAYMAGRRAVGTVLAELLDAGTYETGSRYPAYQLGAIDEQLTHFDPQPLDSSTPPPWRPDGTESYDFQHWCEETEHATQIYAEASSGATHYVLAEMSRWEGDDSRGPKEERQVRAVHERDRPDILIVPRKRAWMTTSAGTRNYFGHLAVSWDHEELVIYGREWTTDPRWPDWLALHPSAGRRVGWQPAPQEPFAWHGDDGQWRARTIRRTRGQLGHRLRGDFDGDVWQVVLSTAGHRELLNAFPAITRQLVVTRSLQPSSASSEEGIAVARLPLIETAHG